MVVGISADRQPVIREDQTGLYRVTERLVVPKKSGNSDGGKGPQFKVSEGSSKKEETGMSLQAPEKVRKLQNTLHAKAKGSPDFRFYVLYDKLYREDILEYAYRCCKANSGAAGVDKIDFIDIET